ncbi:MAG: exodeoxyribonuclease VII large subunit [Lachnospiraceae bacterium]|nr:exodeoxyribonuclease VII large subunit [Lachnospiraceae bacterium]
MSSPRYSVGEISRYIKNLVDGDFLLRSLWVEGEVSNLKYHPSGHIYLTLKDEKGTLKAVMFAGYRKNLRFALQDGMRIIAGGSISVYEQGSSYQLYIRAVEPAGIGQLYQEYEARKKSLEEKGLFDVQYKKAIPRYALRIGVVTASTGAAIQDIVNITHRRNPYAQLVLYPALVQGENAAPSIVKGIETLDQMGLDVLIVGRGGGSLEDLWAFNEVSVAQAIFDASTPVISAVGHETDTTIADFVADLRAPTPSAAAEIACFDVREYLKQCGRCREELGKRFTARLERDKLRIKAQNDRLLRYHPVNRIHTGRLRLAALEEKARMIMERKLQAEKERLARSAAQLESLSPLARLSGGYVFAEDSEGRALRSVGQVRAGDRIRLHVIDGRIRAEVKETENG